jgi:hypothetical protein
MNKSSYIKLMLVCVFIIPLQISSSGLDSTSTNIELIGSVGQYAFVDRGCENEDIYIEKVPIREFSVTLDRKTQSPFRVGITYHFFTAWSETRIYNEAKQRFECDVMINYASAFHPFLNLETKFIGIGIGYVFSDKNIIPMTNSEHTSKERPSLYGRIGKINRLYFDASFFHETPFVAGGYLRLGMGFPLHQRVNYWMGVNVSPYDDFGMAMKMNIHLSGNNALIAFYRTGISEGIYERAVALGIRFQLLH